ncbi:MAG: NAD(+)/NADH kinase [Nanoarchaeota archaeon]|nr:NAD(+)/NADH kinase [Nanoarchaeota archaeon]
MKFNKILVVYTNKNSKNHKECLKNVKDYLSNSEFEIVFSKSEDFERIILDFDLIITIGGDGVFLRVSHFIVDIPIFGINSDISSSQGELTSLSCFDVNILDNVLKGNLKIDERERIDVFLNGELINERALNEVYVGSANQFHTSRYSVFLDGKEEEHRSSGILIVTKTGSTAWYKSAGGKPFEKDILKYLVREPSINRVFDSKILSGEIIDKIKIDSKMNYDGILALDSNKIYPFNFGDSVELKKSNKPLKVVKPL